MRHPALLLALLATAGLASALVPAPGAVHPAPVALPQEGPDAPVLTPPDVVLTVFEDEYWQDTEGPRTRVIVPPAPPNAFWGRILLEYRQWPNVNPAEQDPWDRLCSAAIAGVEVLRCTTPRTDFTLVRDVTFYKRLMLPGVPTPVTVTTGSYSQPEYYVGGQHVRLKLLFYDADEPTGEALSGAAIRGVPVWYHQGTCADGRVLERTVDFGQGTAGGTIELYFSGHGQDEFWWETARQPVFHLSVDGTEVAQVLPLPYVYAFQGYYGGAYTQHPLMWWTAQRALDLAGVHTGVGELPPYRASILPQDLPLFRGVHTVRLVGEGGACSWPASVAVLLS